MPIDLLTTDPATAMPSKALDALMATEVVGWSEDGIGDWVDKDGNIVRRHDRSPTTNPGHAGELRRTAKRSVVDHSGPISSDGYHDPEICQVWLHGGYASCRYDEVDNDPARAEALAICRACLAMIQSQHEKE